MQAVMSGWKAQPTPKDDATLAGETRRYAKTNLAGGVEVAPPRCNRGPSRTGVGTLHRHVPVGTAAAERAVSVSLSSSVEDFAGIVRSHQGTVFRILGKMVSNPERVEDLAQEVFIRVWRGLPYFRGTATFSTWLYRIIYNVVLDDCERSRRQPPMISLDDEESAAFYKVGKLSDKTSAKPERRELLERVNKALRELPPQFRMVLTLFYMEERRYVEIAEIMHVPVGTVKTYLHRGRKALRGILLGPSGQEGTVPNRMVGAKL